MPKSALTTWILFDTPLFRKKNLGASNGQNKKFLINFFIFIFIFLHHLYAQS